MSAPASRFHCDRDYGSTLDMSPTAKGHIEAATQEIVAIARKLYMTARVLENLHAQD
jgi:hypothetical protein